MWMANHRLEACLAAADWWCDRWIIQKRLRFSWKDEERKSWGHLHRKELGERGEGQAKNTYSRYFRLLHPKQPHRKTRSWPWPLHHIGRQLCWTIRVPACFMQPSCSLIVALRGQPFAHVQRGSTVIWKFAVAMAALTDGRLAAWQQCECFDLSLCTKYRDKCRNDYIFTAQWPGDKNKGIMEKMVTPIIPVTLAVLLLKLD